jgi:hypothetical protein
VQLVSGGPGVHLHTRTQVNSGQHNNTAASRAAGWQ